MRRRDENVWQTNWCFTHGYPTAFDKTCEAFRLAAGKDCDVAPATVTRNTPVAAQLRVTDLRES